MPEIGFHHKSFDAPAFVTIPAGGITINPDAGDGQIDGSKWRLPLTAISLSAICS